MTTTQPKPTPTFLKVREALKAAVERGWVVVPQPPGITCVSWTDEVSTPENLRRFWPEPTYDEITFVSFVSHDGRVTSAIVAERTNPIRGGQDSRVSIKAALEILASR